MMQLTEAPPLVSRPLRPADRAAYERAVAALSPRSRRQRFHGPKPTLTPREIDYLLDVGHDGAEALALFDGDEVVAVARYAPFRGEPGVADVAIVVADAWQGRGLGDRLIGELLPLLDAAGYRVARATALADNDAVRGLLAKHGFRTVVHEGSAVTLERRA